MEGPFRVGSTACCRVAPEAVSRRPVARSRRWSALPRFGERPRVPAGCRWCPRRAKQASGKTDRADARVPVGELPDAPASAFLQFLDERQLIPVESVPDMDKAAGIAEREDPGSLLERLLRRVERHIPAPADRDGFPVEPFPVVIEHLPELAFRSVPDSSRTGGNLGWSPHAAHTSIIRRPQYTHLTASRRPQDTPNPKTITSAHPAPNIPRSRHPW